MKLKVSKNVYDDFDDFDSQNFTIVYQNHVATMKICAKRWEELQTYSI